MFVNFKDYSEATISVKIACNSSTAILLIENIKRQVENYLRNQAYKNFEFEVTIVDVKDITYR